MNSAVIASLGCGRKSRTTSTVTTTRCPSLVEGYLPNTRLKQSPPSTARSSFSPRKSSDLEPLRWANTFIFNLKSSITSTYSSRRFREVPPSLFGRGAASRQSPRPPAVARQPPEFTPARVHDHAPKRGCARPSRSLAEYGANHLCLAVKRPATCV